MTSVKGIVGLRPAPAIVARVACPPYDVIKEGSPLQARLRSEPLSMVHVTLGDAPVEALARLREDALIEDDEPAFYVIEQRFGERTRLGVYTAVAVSEYAAGDVIRHEKTFDDKVRGRIALTEATGHVIGPVFLLTRAPLADALAGALDEAPLYDFTHDFGGGTDLHGIETRVWRVPEESPRGRAIQDAIAREPLYIADGHHRYHAALKGGLSHALAYVTDGARILAYDRVVNGTRPFSEVRDQLPLEPTDAFETPPKHSFALYSKEGSFLLKAQQVPSDVVGRLDCAILERELYPWLGLTHDHVTDPAHFDYYPESALDEMKAAVDEGRYELAIALHPVSEEELMAVADTGLQDPDVVMPEKSTFFSPKIPTGIVLLRATKRPGAAGRG